MKLTPVLADPEEIRSRIRAKAVDGLKAAFPLTAREHTIHLDDVHILEKDFGPDDQKHALLEGSTLHEPVKGTVTLRDKEGKVVEKVKNFTLLHLPYFTERHSFIIDGNEYQVANQVRMKPGVYARRRANEELEAAFNTVGSENFKLSLDPAKGHPYMEYGTTAIPLYPVLRKLGMPHQDIARHWGSEVAETNRVAFDKKADGIVEKLYKRLIHPSKQDHGAPIEAKVDAIRRVYEKTKMDPEVNERTLGEGHDRLTPHALLDASKKLLEIYKSGRDVDDRDSLAFKTFHSVDDFIKEKIGLEARTVAMKAKGRAASKTTLREILPSAPFSSGVRSFLTGSKLSAIPTQINPMELVDHDMKVTSLGEGGIASERAVPLEARQLHPTHLGLLDPVRTPESFSAGIDVRATLLTRRDDEGNLYAPLRDPKTGKFDYLSARQIENHVVAFPGQKMVGMVEAMKNGKVQHVPAHEVQYEIHDPALMLSPTSNLIPLLDSIQGNRATMGSKMQTQALPLVHRDVPYVQSGTRIIGDDKEHPTSFEKLFGRNFVVPYAPVAGRIAKIDHQYIYIEPTSKHADEALKKTRFQGISIHLDRPKGFKKMMKSPTGPPEELTYKHDYGFFPGVMDHDGEDLDVFIGPHNDAKHVYVIEKYKRDAEGKKTHFDEHKCFVGFNSKADATASFDFHVHPDCKGKIETLTIDDFKKQLRSGGVKVAGAVKYQKTVGDVTMKLELEKGDVRSGVSADGKAWSKTMECAYGHIPKTTGDDGETIDVYLNESDPLYLNVYVVHQKKKDGSHDEDKCMVGFKNYDAAVAAYKKHGPAWGLGEVDTYQWDDWVDEYIHPRKKTAAEKSNLIKIPYHTNFPFASKTYLHHDLKVKEGDEVEADQILADSNFTRDGTLALGKNLRVAYMPYYGLNSNDAVVISEDAAKKLTSEHMYKEMLDVSPDTTLGREAHRQYYGSKYVAKQYDKLDVDGVVKKGQKVLPHDPIIVGLRKGKLSATDIILGNLKKTLANPYKEEVREWHHDFEGEVIDVYKSPKRVVVTIRTQEPMRIGDKLSGRYGNKGVISHIVPMDQMIHTEDEKPIDIIYTSAGVISRINPAQVTETALAKIAEKTGKPIVVQPETGRNNVEWAMKLLKEHGIKDKETIFDPVSGKKIPNIFVGPQYTLRLFKTTDSNFSARGTGGYDVNRQPTKGGEEGAKAVGAMEFNALVAHNARNVLRETAALKGEQNDEFWRAVQLGLPLPPLKSSFVHDKLLGLLQGAGVALDKRGSVTTLRPMTDNDVKRMSSGAVENEKLIRAKDLMPERGGFFDAGLTGGPSGTKWSHIELAEPVVNPVFAEPARRLLGLTTRDFEQLLFKEGGASMKRKLNAIDLDEKERALKKSSKELNGSKLDDAVKQLKYVRALKKVGLRAGDAYVISKLPVIPPVLRPVLPGHSGNDLVVGDTNYLYQSAFLHNKSLKTQVEKPILPPDEHAVLRKNLFNAVGAVVGTHDTDNPKLAKRNVKGFLVHLTGKTTPKSSFFQQKIVKRQQDISGRGTAAPDGTLEMDQVGIPEEMMWGMFGKFIISRLVRRGFSAVQAKEMLEERHPAARDALLAEIKERPVMVNRAPTLHRYNVVGAYAVPVAGKTIRVNPFIEAGMNLDYDGDTLTVHAPVLPGAIENVKDMTLSKLLFSDKTRDSLMVAPKHEATMGIHVASLPANSGPVHKFKSKEEAFAAYKRGEIKLQDKVEVAS